MMSVYLEATSIESDFYMNYLVVNLLQTCYGLMIGYSENKNVK